MGTWAGWDGQLCLSSLWTGEINSTSQRELLWWFKESHSLNGHLVSTCWMLGFELWMWCDDWETGVDGQIDIHYWYPELRLSRGGHPVQREEAQAGAGGGGQDTASRGPGRCSWEAAWDDGLFCVSTERRHWMPRKLATHYFWMCVRVFVEEISIKMMQWTSLVAQWQRIDLPIQETQVQSCSGRIPRAVEHLSSCATTIELGLESWGTATTEPIYHYWSLHALEPVLHNKRSQRNEKPSHHNWRVAPSWGN